MLFSWFGLRLHVWAYACVFAGMRRQTCADVHLCVCIVPRLIPLYNSIFNFVCLLYLLCCVFVLLRLCLGVSGACLCVLVRLLVRVLVRVLVCVLVRVRCTST